MSVMAMYDVRGIQRYVFRTPKIRDAIGASDLVGHIIEDALQCAVDELKLGQEAGLLWCTENGPIPYQDDGKKLQVLYIGGGNGYVLCQDRDLCVRINRIMAKYTIAHTYSLQLAVAMVDVTGDYYDDYNRLMEEMSRVKEEMVLSKPVGALPVMAVEVKTGYPSSADVMAGRLRDSSDKISTESLLKLQQEQGARTGVTKQMKILDNYTTQKGVDSTIAVVHIDGNNMGQRIREQISTAADYQTAINRMRRISYNISSSFLGVFESMQKLFNEHSGERKEYEQKATDDFVLKVVSAGDDITYICNGKIALATVECYCSEISKYTLTGDTDEDSIQKYGFSVCAGIAYMGSHFPFHVGYEVAEACCRNAKKFAKDPRYLCGYGVGNWVDFHLCKNIQAQNLDEMRRQEYITSHGEELLGRPYFVRTERDGESSGKTSSGKTSSGEQRSGKQPSEETSRGALFLGTPQAHSLDALKRNILYFQNEEHIPRSFAKNLRNLYSEGAVQVELYRAFLESRNWKMPDGSFEMYDIETDGKTGGEILRAKWYDALEMLDYYMDLSAIKSTDVKNMAIENTVHEGGQGK